MNTITRNFDSVAHFLATLPTLETQSEYNSERSLDRTNPRDWLGMTGTGRATMQQVCDYLQNFRADTGALDVSGIEPSDAKTRTKTMQYSGNFCSVDAQRYIDGESFLGVRKRQRTGRIITLKIAVNYLASVDAARVAKQAQMLVNFIHAVESEGHQVALTIGYFGELSTAGKQHHKTTMTIKSAGEYMDASNLFVCVHPAFFRSLILGMRVIDAPSKISTGISHKIHDPNFFDLLDLTTAKLMELAR